MRLLTLFFIASLVLITNSSTLYAQDNATNGLWFECEFASRQAPPKDNCAMLDDDGFLFEKGTVTYVKVTDSPEVKGCKKQRAGQCFRADRPAIKIKEMRKGEAFFSPTRIEISFLGCTQVYHVKPQENYLEARPDDKRCIWAGEKRFYLRQYLGEVVMVK